MIIGKKLKYMIWILMLYKINHLIHLNKVKVQKNKKMKLIMNYQEDHHLILHKNLLDKLEQLDY